MVARAAREAYVAPPNVVNVLLLTVGSFTTGGVPNTDALPLSVTLPPLSRTPAKGGPGGSQLVQPVGGWSTPLMLALPLMFTRPCVVRDAWMPKSTGAIRAISPM